VLKQSGMTPYNILNNSQNQQFEVFVDEDRAFLEYRMRDGMLFLMHTEVPEKIGGKGIASALAEYAFHYAREHRLPVKVYCPYVTTWLKRHPENMDIVVASI
jgi:predicted GNAT family acetyltransferase